MLARLRSFLFKTPVKVAFGLVAAWLLFGWLALGPLLKWGAEKFVSDKTGHHLVMDTPRFDPLGLTLILSNVRLTEPDGKLLAGFRELYVDFDGSSLFRWAWIFDTIRLVKPEGDLTLLPGGKLNWTPFIDAFKSEAGSSQEQSNNGGMPRLLIRHFALVDGQADFVDRTVQPAFKTVFKPLDLTLDDLSTLPDDNGVYQISARTPFGAVLHWKGNVDLEPVAVTGSLSLEGIQLGQLAPYLQRRRVNIAALEGQVAIGANYHLTYADKRLGLTLDRVGLVLEGLKLRGTKAPAATLAVDRFEVKDGDFDLASHAVKLGNVELDGGQINLIRLADGRFDIEHWLSAPKAATAPAAQAGEPVTPWHVEVAKVGMNNLDLNVQGQGVAAPVDLKLGSLRVEGTSVDLAGRKATVNLLALDKPEVMLERAADGSLPVLAAFASQTSSPAEAAPKDAQPGPGWNWSLARAELNGGSVELRDEAVKPSASLTLDNIDASIDGLSQDLGAKLPVKLAFKVKEGGSLSALGTLVPGKGALDAKLDLIGLSLKPAQPYLGQYTKLRLTSGKLGSRGQLIVGSRTEYRGAFRVSGLNIAETDTGKRFLAWRSLSGTGLKAGPQGVGIRSLRLDGLGAKLIIHKDKSTNLADIMRKSPASGPSSTKAPETKAVKTKTAGKAKGSAFPVSIETVTVKRSDMDFADESLVLPFATHIHGLKGHINGIGSRPGARARLELDGLVDKYGLARAAGKIDLFDPTGYTDVKVQFKNVEMTKLTPYSATFAGREIASGKLSLDLEYKIKDRQLVGDNRVVMDKLTLGKRVESPTAKNLPLDLAIAILQDSNGVIDLGLPVSGSLDDPQFSYGRIVWKAITNLIGKIVLAPFKALGSLFGGGGENVSAIAFDAGQSSLLPPEKEKLKRAVQILAKRPRLALVVQGGWSVEADSQAIKEQRVRRALAEAMGRTLEPGEEPGPVDLASEKAHAALEKLYAKRFGSDALAAFKSKFAQANPAPPPTSAVGQLWSGVSGLFKGKPAPITPAEMAQMKGADPGRLMFDALVGKEQVTDAELAALGKARAAAMMAELATLAAPAGRVMEKPAKPVSGTTGAEVTLKLGLEVAASPVPDAAPAPQPTQ